MKCRHCAAHKPTIVRGNELVNKQKTMPLTRFSEIIKFQTETAPDKGRSTPFSESFQ